MAAPPPPSSSSSPRGHSRAAPWLARILSAALLCLFAYAAVRDASSEAASSRRPPVYLTTPGFGGRKHPVAFSAPWFCHGAPCAPFAADAAHSGSGYEARAYEPATYISVDVTAINAEVALAEGVLMLERYARGANAANASVPRGPPTLVVLRPTSDAYDGLTPSFTVASYLPPLAAAKAAAKAGAATSAAAPFPAPTDEGVALTARPAAPTFVLPFGGFARGGVALANAARVALALTRARIPFTAGGPFALALYDPASRWAGRHNEVWLWGAGAEWAGGGGGGGRDRSSGGGGGGGVSSGDGRPVATHLL